MFGRRKLARKDRESFARYMRKSKRLMGEVEHLASNVVAPMLEDRLNQEEGRQRAFVKLARMCGLSAETIASEKGISLTLVLDEFERVAAAERASSST